MLKSFFNKSEIAKEINRLDKKICCTQACEIWTAEERKLFKDLKDRVDALEAKCDIQPYYASHSVDYDVETITTILNDKLPLPSCDNEKGVLFMNNYIVFAWHHPTDGWVEYDKIGR